jgi:hypothetical protein
MLLLQSDARTVLQQLINPRVGRKFQKAASLQRNRAALPKRAPRCWLRISRCHVREPSAARSLGERPGAASWGPYEVVHSALTGNSEVAKHQRSAENRMETHKNAALTPEGREAMVRAVVDFSLSQGRPQRGSSTRRRNPSPNGSAASARKTWMARATARHHHIHCQAKQRLPHAPPPRRCGASAPPASISQPNSRYRRPPRAVAVSPGIEPDPRPGAGRAGAPL